MSRKRSLTILLLLAKLPLLLSFNFLPKAFKVESFHSCPDMPNLPNNMDNVTVTMIQRNLYVLNGYLDITKDINVPVALSMDVKRCTLDKTHCEDYDSLTITKLCGKLKDAKALWAPMIESIQPTPLCPVKHGIYRMTNATANLAVVSRLPLDGYRWVVRFTVHQDGDKKKILICLDAEVSITNQKRRHE